MTSQRTRAVAALERWRSFQEARAALAHRTATSEAAQAAELLDEANRVALAAQQTRASLLGAQTLDLDRCQAVEHIEAHLWRHASQCEVALAQAREAAQLALQRHRDAHALKEVAARRGQRLESAEREREERTTSDRLAELRTGVTRTLR